MKMNVSFLCFFVSCVFFVFFFFFSSRRRHTRFDCDWSSDVCSSDLETALPGIALQRKTAVDYVLRHVDGGRGGVIVANPTTEALRALGLAGARSKIGRASCRERV